MISVAPKELEPHNQRVVGSTPSYVQKKDSYKSAINQFINQAHMYINQYAHVHEDVA